MKKLVSKVQRLNQKAADLRQVIENVSPKMGQIRQAVGAAVGQVQKLRAEIASGVSPLRSETDEQLVTLLREVDGGTAVFTEAGVRLIGVDMDLGINRRIIVQLERFERVGPARLRALLAAHAQEPALKALLTALLHADELAESVELTQLSFERLTVEVGLIPSVRIGWRTESPATPEPSGMLTPSNTTVAPALASMGALSSSFSASAGSEISSVLQRRPIVEPSLSLRPPVELEAPETVVPPKLAPIVPPKLTLPGTPAAGPGQGKDWRKHALDRFKKMPDLTKR